MVDLKTGTVVLLQTKKPTSDELIPHPFVVLYRHPRFPQKYYAAMCSSSDVITSEYTVDLSGVDIGMLNKNVSCSTCIIDNIESFINNDGIKVLSQLSLEKTKEIFKIFNKYNNDINKEIQNELFKRFMED